MTNTPERDPLEELLAPPQPAGAEVLRQTVLTTTTRRLLRRRWLRRAALTTALAACFAAGMLAMRLLTPAAPQTTPDQESVQRRQEPPPVPRNETPAPPEREADVAAVLLRVGDRYLNEGGDPEAALRCYTRALNASSAEDARFSPDDNWLLMALKNAREKEARHANNGG